jgi:hypothetical protein
MYFSYKIKAIKFNKKIAKRLLYSLLLGMGILISILALNPVQSYLANKLSFEMKDRFDLTLNVDRVDLSFLGSVDLEGVYIEDHHGNPLIRIDKLSSSLSNIYKITQGELMLKDVVLNGVRVDMTTYPGESETNMDVFINKFKPQDDKARDGTLIFKMDNVAMYDAHYVLKDLNKKPEPVIEFHELKGELRSFRVYPNSLEVRVEGLAGTDGFGMNYEELSLNFYYTPENMQFNDLDVKTGTSHIKGQVRFDYQKEDLRDFVNKVQITADFYPSYVSLRDFHKLYEPIADRRNQFYFSGKFKGTVNEFEFSRFRSSIQLADALPMEYRGNLRFKNTIQNSEEEPFSFESKIDRLHVSRSDLTMLLPEMLEPKIPAQIQTLGKVQMNGIVSMTGDHLSLDSDFKTELGDGYTKIELDDLKDRSKIKYRGDIILEDFDLGTLLNEKYLGQVDLKGDIAGTGFDFDVLNTYFKGEINEMELGKYSYEGVRVDGVFSERKFEGSLEVNDPNLKLHFKGLADLASRIRNYDFTAVVEYADLKALGYSNRDSISQVSGSIDLDIVGNSWDNLIGAAKIVDLTYTNQNDTYEFEETTIRSSRYSSNRELTVESKDILSGELKGDFDYQTLDKLVRNAIGAQFSNYKPYMIRPNQHFELDLNVYSKVIQVFVPSIQFSENTRLRASLDNRTAAFKVKGEIPEMIYDRRYFKGLEMDVDKSRLDTISRISFDQYRSKNMKIENLELSNHIDNDTLYFNTVFIGGKNLNQNYDLDFYFTMSDEQVPLFGFLPSAIVYKNKNWEINPNRDLSSNRIFWDFRKGDISVEDVVLGHKDQKLSINGKVQDSTYKNIEFQMVNLYLEDIMPEVDSLRLEGRMNGTFTFIQENQNYNPYGEFQIEDFVVNESLQGDLFANVNSIDGSLEAYQVDLNMKRSAYKNLDARGRIDFGPDVPQIDLEVDLEEFKLDLFSPLGKDVISQIRGLASGSFMLQGDINNPDWLGEMYLEGAGMKFPYLNVDYEFIGKPRIGLFQNSFLFNEVRLRDTDQMTTGTLSGSISHDGFQDWELDLGIRTDRMLVLNTEETETSLFYGKAFIEGNADIYGLTSELTIDVTARTLEGTEFIIPLSDVKTAENSKLIVFKNKEVKSSEFDIDEILELEDVKGLNLNFNLQVTKDAVAEIVIDKVSGSYIRGSGSGNLQMNIDTQGSFTMIGDFVIDNGVYNFSYGGIINKPFIVEKGGRISWSGNPYLANLDIKAIHTVYANPKSLLENINTSRRIPVDLVTDISGELYATEQEFDIVIPNSSSTVANEMEFVLNNNGNNERMRQFFSLLITKNFYSESTVNNVGANAITGTTTDLISGVLSDVLNSPDSKLQVDVGYSVADATEVETLDLNDQLDFSLATQINDNILINGNIGVPVGGVDTDNTVVGEVKVEFLMNEEGTFRTSIFNRQNEIQYSDEEEGYTQGVGLSYQIDFDHINEVWAKFKGKRKKQAKEEDLDKNLKDKDKTLYLFVPTVF